MKKMEKKKIRIGELSESLGVEKFVIRFWEKEFNFKGKRSDGGQRYYTEKDLERFHLIKDLLYNQGFTIAGAKKHLKSNTSEKSPSQTETEAPIIASQITTLEESSELAKEKAELPADLSQQILDLQRKLVKLRELL